MGGGDVSGVRGPTAVVMGIVVVLGLIVTLGVVLTRNDDSDRAAVSSGADPTSATFASPAPTDTSTTAGSGLEGTVYTDPSDTYRITLGPDWTEGPLGFAASPTWLAPQGAAGSARVNILLTRAATPRSLDQFVEESIDRLDGGRVYTVTGTDPITLADGTPGARLRLSSASDTLIRGEATASSEGLSGVLVLADCPPPDAESCFAALDPYVRSIVIL